MNYFIYIRPLFVLLFLLSYVLPAQAEKGKQTPFNIITSFYPLYFFSKEITADIPKNNLTHVVDLANQVPIHDYQLSPKDRIKLQQADLVILFGKNLESWGASITAQLPSNQVLVINSFTEKELAKTKKQHEEHDEHDHHAHEDDKHHNHEEHSEHDHHAHEDDKHHNHEEHSEHDHDAHEDDKHHNHEEHSEHDHHDHHAHDDPHLWLDPLYSQQIVDKITAKLIALPYYHNIKSQILANATRLKHKLAKLDKDYSRQMINCHLDTIIISHDVLGYLSERYGFKSHSILGLSTHDEPSAKTIRTLIDLIQSNQLQYFLNDGSIQSQSYLSIIDPSHKLKGLRFNTLEQNLSDSEGDFFQLSYENLHHLIKARQCQP